MKRIILVFLIALMLIFTRQSSAKITDRVVEIDTRTGVTQRFVLITPENPTAAVILFAGGHGGLQISSTGHFKWGKNNFLIRSRKRFAENKFLVAVIDAPSDRQAPPYLGRFRQTAEHVADVKALIGWLKQQANIPVWLVGTSRGTQSAAYVSTQLVDKEGPDGLVLTSTILKDNKSRPVPDMNLGKIKIPVLIVHHEQDGCKHCKFRDMPLLMDKLISTQRKQLISFRGGDTKGDPCRPFAYHGFNGIEQEVVKKIAGWIVSKH